MALINTLLKTVLVKSDRTKKKKKKPVMYMPNSSVYM